MNYIINSLLDLDFYKLTMGQFVFHRYPNVPVEYELMNRTKYAHLGRFITENDLRTELDHVESLRFGREDIDYLGQIQVDEKLIFSRDYLNFLSGFRMPSYRLKRVGEDYKLTFSGQWAEAIYWETIALSIVNELYYRSLGKHLSYERERGLREYGITLLTKKMERLSKSYDRERVKVKFSDFGTRRRYSREWQEWIVVNLRGRERFLGTSNVLLAKNLELPPIGTMAHELFMVAPTLTGRTSEEISQSQNMVYDEWWDEYGEPFSIALTDTYGSDFFFRTFGKERALKWKGLRQDSGNAIEFGEKAIKFYEGQGIDPRGKLIVFSDGLDVNAMIFIADTFWGRINFTFGWGTDLTNDVGFKPLSLVVKVTKANNQGTVKLSDNLAKAMGEDDDVRRFKKIFGYTNIDYKECKY